VETTITGVSTGQVRDWLARVLAHRGTDDTLPFLTRVQITIGDRHLIAAATDRYTLAVARLNAETGTTRARFTLPGDWADQVMAELPGGQLSETPATLTLNGETFTIEATDYTDEDFEPYFDGEWNTTTVAHGGTFFDWQPLVRSLLAAPADPAPVHVAARLLGRFTAPGAVTLDPAGPLALDRLAPGPNLPPLTLHSPGGGRPVLLLERGFLGLLPIWRPRPGQLVSEPPTPAPAAWRDAWADLLDTDRVPVPA
jgi:DNA polymerase III beta subunit, central domain